MLLYRANETQRTGDKSWNSLFLLTPVDWIPTPLACCRVTVLTRAFTVSNSQSEYSDSHSTLAVVLGCVSDRFSHALSEGGLHNRLNKDGRLIRADYVLRKTAAPGNVENIIALIRTPRLLFLFCFRTRRSYLNVRLSYGAALAFRLVSESAKLKLSQEASSDAPDRVHWTLDSHSN